MIEFAAWRGNEPCGSTVSNHPVYEKLEFPCSVWCIASVIGLAELNCAVTSYLCAVSIILRINKRARHRSVNILAGQRVVDITGFL